MDSTGRAIVNVHLTEKEQGQDALGDDIDIPMNDETAEAATKIQAKFRHSVLLLLRRSRVLYPDWRAAW